MSEEVSQINDESALNHYLATLRARALAKHEVTALEVETGIAAIDRLRERLFGMQSSDGEGPGTLYHSYRDLIANTSVGVSFDTPGTTVRNALESAALGYAGMDHDYLNDFFLYIDSYNPGVIYKVTPNGNSDTGWKMEIFTPAAGSTSIWSSGSLVMMGHVRYIEKLRGFLIYTDAVNRPMYYLRTSL